MNDDDRQYIANTKKTGKSHTVQILRIILLVIGSVTVLFYFFSFIGILIGAGFILFSRNTEWKVNGAVLALSSALSTWVSSSGIELAPLKLAAITGPTILVVYFVLKFVFKKLGSKGRLPAGFQRLKSIKLKPSLKRTIIILAVALPVFIWQSVSMDYGVLFNNSPQLLWVHAPTTVQKGEDFKITVQCWDPYERLSALHDGTVSFELESYDMNTLEPVASVSANLPLPYTFNGQDRGSSMAYWIRDGKDNGIKNFYAAIHTEGIHYIKVTDTRLAETYYSNPILVDDYSDSGYRIYWGDIHTHSILSDGSGSLEHNLFYGRDIACLEFMSLTDHAEILMWKPGVYDRIERGINLLNEPGEFVAFQGFEWTQTEDGHYTVIFSGDRLLKHVNFLNTPEPQDLWARLDDFTSSTGMKALALPHHTTKKEYIQDWTYVNPKYVKIAEVASTHGNFLFEPWDDLNYIESINPPPDPQNGTSIMDAILMGHRLTLYAASDSHGGHPGHTIGHTDASIGHQRPLTYWLARNEKPYPGGITAVYASSLSRKGIFEALENQRIYASSDLGRPYLYFSINGTGAENGNQLVVDPSDAVRELKIVFAQDGAYAPQRSQTPIDGAGLEFKWDATVEIFKNGKLWRSVEVNEPVTGITLVDEFPITGAEYGFEKCILRGDRYYINEYSDQPVDPSELNTDGVDFYIVRAVSENGREAYAGPIWVSTR